MEYTYIPYSCIGEIPLADRLPIEFEAFSDKEARGKAEKISSPKGGKLFKKIGEIKPDEFQKK